MCRCNCTVVHRATRLFKNRGITMPTDPHGWKCSYRTAVQCPYRDTRCTEVYSRSPIVTNHYSKSRVGWFEWLGANVIICKREKCNATSISLSTPVRSKLPEVSTYLDALSLTVDTLYGVFWGWTVDKNAIWTRNSRIQERQGDRTHIVDVCSVSVWMYKFRRRTRRHAPVVASVATRALWTRWSGP